MTSLRTLPFRRGLTLVDLMIFVGTLLTCVAILLPIIQSARNVAATQRCADNLRLMMAAVEQYAGKYRRAIPGSPWTSSAHLRTPQDFNDPAAIPAGVTSPTNTLTTGPFALFDWLTPIANELRLPGLPPEGASPRDRYLALVNHPQLSCPAHVFPAFPIGDLTFPVSRAPSYRTNLDFLLRSSVFSAPAPESLTRFVSAPWAQLPPYYRPELKSLRIGNLSKKIYLLEGAGLLDPELGRLQYPTRFVSGETEGGALATPRPYAYRLLSGTNSLLLGNMADRTHPHDPTRENFYLLATARHGTSSLQAPLTSYTLHAAYFDGHVERLDLFEALNPSLHSPPRTVIRLGEQRIYPRVSEHYFKGRQEGYWVVPP